MPSAREFRNPPAQHEAADDALERALRDPSFVDDAVEALVGSALGDDDAGRAERLCLTAGTRALPGSPLLGAAGLCLGHLARRFGRLSDEALALVQSLAARAEADPSDVDTRALDGYDDVQSFLGPR